nr:MAG TPA: hypothetical protein [Caudoviricetes sp.]
MIVKDLRNSFNPVPKPGQKKTKQDRKKVKDFCIMPINNSYSTVRTEVFYERHEVYFSKAYRQKSIDDGLIVFLTRKSHRGTNGVHGKNGDKLNRKLKRLAEKAWISYYNKTKEEFIKRYGKSN